MSNIIDKIQQKIKNIDSIYEYPNDAEFHRLVIPVFDWPSPKDGNFFNIIRVLTIRGPISLVSLANLHTDADHPYNSVFQTIYRLLNGSPNGTNISLQQRELVNKKGRLFNLTPIGVLYAIHVFHMDGYYDKEHTKFTKTDDFSYQKDIHGIFDIIKKHYSDYFPLLFDNLDYIKESKDIDINIFFDILDPDNIIDGHTFYNFNKPSTLEFDSELNEMIPFVFYYYSAISTMVNKKKDLKLTDQLKLDLGKIADKMSEKMEKDTKLYRSINIALFK